MPRWTSDFFRDNRRKFASQIDGGLAVISGHSQVQSVADMVSEFRQESNFWYLTGISDPGWVLIYDGGRDYAWLVAPSLSSAEKLFDGELDHDEVLKTSGVNEIISEDEYEPLLRQQLRRHNTVHTLLAPKGILPNRVSLNPSYRQTVKRLERIFVNVLDCHKPLANLRAIKTDPEIAAIKAAVDATLRGFESAKQSIAECGFEHEVEAAVAYQIRLSGGRHAYEPIVASGKRACTLHYTANSHRIRSGDAVLIDIGAQLDGYCADITRTYAKSDPSVKYQKYHRLLSIAQSEIIALIKPGVSLTDYSAGVDEIMRNAICEMGLIPSPDHEDYRRYFPHAVSHGLGIDVHDSLGEHKSFVPGMVITVEPGVYDVASGIGIRIEDNVVITQKGSRNLSRNLSTDWA